MHPFTGLRFLQNQEVNLNKMIMHTNNGSVSVSSALQFLENGVGLSSMHCDQENCQIQPTDSSPEHLVLHDAVKG